MVPLIVIFVVSAIFATSILVGLDNAKEQKGTRLNAGEKYSYSVICESFDWGPVITKVVMCIDESLDEKTLFVDDFKVSCSREYNLDGSSPSKIDYRSEVETNQVGVTELYISDEKGNPLSTGRYLTFALEIKPDSVDNSPINYKNDYGKCSYVNISYIIELLPNSRVRTTDGKELSFFQTDKWGFVGLESFVPDGFDFNGKYKSKGVKLTYGTFTPKGSPSDDDKTPLIVFLHGYGEGGEDPSLVVMGNEVANLASKEIQDYFGDTGAYLLIPQAPTSWMDYDGSGESCYWVKGSNGHSYYTEALMGLIKKFVAQHPDIDKNRIYLGGLSNGGYMTLNMLFNYPDYFAAAFPICEAYSDEWVTDEKIDEIHDIPIWFTHAKTDRTIVIYKIQDGVEEKAYNSYTNAAYRRLVQAGATNVHYSLYDKVIDTSGRFFKEETQEPYEYNGHFSWIYVFNNECADTIDGEGVALFDWLSQQKKV